MLAVAQQTTLSLWLKAEMPRRGYPLDGHRAGGISTLASNAGIPQATMSRLVHGQGEASVDNLRKLAKVFGLTLREMMIIAGLAEHDEMAESSDRPQVAVTEDHRLHIQVTVDPEIPMVAALKLLDPLSRNERILVANLEAMQDYSPAEIYAAVMSVRASVEARRGGRADIRKQA